TAPLYLLAELWNIDKHRTLHLCEANARLVFLRAAIRPVLTLVPPKDVAKFVWLRELGPMEDGALIAHVQITPWTLNVQMEAHTATDVEFKEVGRAKPPTMNVGRLLDSLLVCASEAVRALWPFFPAT